jgi:hypothetical protein
MAIGEPPMRRALLKSRGRSALLYSGEKVTGHRALSLGLGFWPTVKSSGLVVPAPPIEKARRVPGQGANSDAPRRGDIHQRVTPQFEFWSRLIVAGSARKRRTSSFSPPVLLRMGYMLAQSTGAGNEHERYRNQYYRRSKGAARPITAAACAEDVDQRGVQSHAR